MAGMVADVSAATFEREVLERSRNVPVVVDFWAPWCQPCRVLGPILEEAVGAMGGRVALAKVNVDENPELAEAFGVSGIPAVKAIRDGRVVAEFVGALPRDQVEMFLRRLVPDAAEQRLAEAHRLAEAGRLEEAIATLEDAIAQGGEQASAGVRLALARLLVMAGRTDRAAEVLGSVEPGTPEHDQAEGLRLLLAMLEAGKAAGGTEPARQRVAADPASSEARFALAGALWAAGRRREAMAELLEIVRRDRGFRDDGARRALLAAFEILGRDDPDVAEIQGRLAGVLFS
ncbi:MAG: co-chaperone YbbN [Acidobacteria bacterium]|nr:MAG: co-chaperone YbbN [Acidobacteriota bacterium]